MDREQARQEIRHRISCKEYLTKSKGKLFVCPFCGSGTIKKKTGAVKLHENTNTWHCFACGKTGDVIDLYRNKTGASYNEALSLLANSLNITIDSGRPTETKQGGFLGDRGRNMPQNSENAQEGEKTGTGNKEDLTEYFKKCQNGLNHETQAREYLKSRGISIETAQAYGIGFDRQADPAGTGHPCPRMIIPTSTTHYIGRRIDGVKDFEKLNNKGGTPDIFNKSALYAQDVQEIFITEGAFDALSILEAGYTAIAINSTANADRLIKQLEQRRTGATLIICMDKDEAGQRAAETIKAGLQKLNIAHICADISGAFKDPNEALTGDRQAFIEALAKAKHGAAKKPDNTSYYIDNLMSREIERFKGDIKTGFFNFDMNSGGLYSGLYVLAAISSLGKTSFALQIADQIAAGGRDVLFFSLEQSRLELVSKSLARYAAQAEQTGAGGTAITALKIRKGEYREQAQAAAQAYKKAQGDRLNIIEGNFACNISFIGNYIRRYIEQNKTQPIVFIDYLQILQPTEDIRRQSTKEIIDNAVTELKRLSRELDITIIVISSVNRANYLTPIDFEALKESGGIEYSCDVLFGLQLAALNNSIFAKEGNIKEKREKIKEAKAENPRRIELVCLKNRFGIANYNCFFNYYPERDLFTEAGQRDPEKKRDKWANAPCI